MALFRKNNRNNGPEEELGFLIDQERETGRVKLPDVYISDLAKADRTEKKAAAKAEAKERAAARKEAEEEAARKAAEEEAARKAAEEEAARKAAEEEAARKAAEEEAARKAAEEEAARKAAEEEAARKAAEEEAARKAAEEEAARKAAEEEAARKAAEEEAARKAAEEEAARKAAEEEDARKAAEEEAARKAEEEAARKAAEEEAARKAAEEEAARKAAEEEAARKAAEEEAARKAAEEEAARKTAPESEDDIAARIGMELHALMLDAEDEEDDTDEDGEELITSALFGSPAVYERAEAKTEEEKVRKAAAELAEVTLEEAPDAAEQQTEVPVPTAEETPEDAAEAVPQEEPAGEQEPEEPVNQELSSEPAAEPVTEEGFPEQERREEKAEPAPKKRAEEPAGKSPVLGLSIAILVLAFLAAAAAAFLFFRGGSAAKMTGLSLSVSPEEIRVGGTAKLIPAVEPENAAGTVLTYTSSDEAVASVTDGTVYGLSEGRAVVTVSAEGFSADVTVKVLPALPDLKKIMEEYANGYYASVSSDGKMLTIDTNSQDVEEYNDPDAYRAIEKVNEALGFSESLYQLMSASSVLDGLQYEKNGMVSVTWIYHPSCGLEVAYMLNES